MKKANPPIKLDARGKYLVVKLKIQSGPLHVGDLARVDGQQCGSKGKGDLLLLVNGAHMLVPFDCIEIIGRSD